MLGLILNHIQNIIMEGTFIVYNKDSETFCFLYDVDGGEELILSNSNTIESWLVGIGIRTELERLDILINDSIYEDNETIIYWLEK